MTLNSKNVNEANVNSANVNPMTSEAQSPVLSCRSLVKSFAAKQRAERLSVLQGVDLTLEPNQMIAITGSSGCGKSTLLHLLGGLDRPDSGEIIWGDQAIGGLSANELARLRNRRIGFVFQFHHLLPEFSALENVMMPALIRGDASRSASDRAAGLLERFQLQDRIHHRPAELSGGEQQRIAMARALMNEPPVVLADEPTGNLDETNTERMLELIFEIRDEFQTSFILITHEKEIAARCDVHFLLQNGQIERQ